jgi:hypothetical protein
MWARAKANEGAWEREWWASWNAGIAAETPEGGASGGGNPFAAYELASIVRGTGCRKRHSCKKQVPSSSKEENEELCGTIGGVAGGFIGAVLGGPGPGGYVAGAAGSVGAEQAGKKLCG